MRCVTSTSSASPLSQLLTCCVSAQVKVDTNQLRQVQRHTYTDALKHTQTHIHAHSRTHWHKCFSFLVRMKPVESSRNLSVHCLRRVQLSVRDHVICISRFICLYRSLFNGDLICFQCPVNRTLVPAVISRFYSCLRVSVEVKTSVLCRTLIAANKPSMSRGSKGIKEV